MATTVGENLVYCPGLDLTFNNSAIQFESLHKKDLKEEQKNVPKEETKVEKVKELGIFEFRTKIVWFNAIGFFIMHLAGIYGIGLTFRDMWYGHFGTFLWLFALTFFGGEGITFGAHRLWTHKSFKATLPLQIFLIILQTLAGQNCCYIWARDHRQHHKYSDTDADPHNANRGFFFSHMGWLMMKKHPEVIRKGKGVDMSDLEANPVIMFQKKYYKPLYFVIAMIFPIFTPVYFWNETVWNSIFINFFARYIILLNITWCVNSVAHMFGTKPYDKNILPVESLFVSLIGLGEGWHNYHHVFPWDYKASEFGMKLNFTTSLINMCAKLGWVYDLREVSHNVMVKRIKRSGDGSHPVYSEVNYTEEKDKKASEAYETKHLGTAYDTEDETLNEEEESSENMVKETEINSEEGIRSRIKNIRHG